MEYTHYKLLNQSELRYIENSLHKAFNSWASVWANDEIECKVVCHRVAETNVNVSQSFHDDPWIFAGIDNKSWVACNAVPDAVMRLAHLLVVSKDERQAMTELKVSTLLCELALSALADLIEHIGSAGGKKYRPKNIFRPNENFWKAGSGAILAEIGCAGNSIFCILSPTLVASLLLNMSQPERSKESLSTTSDALKNTRMKLNIMVGEVQLSLGLLQTISLGDVIKLDAKVDQPLNIVTSEGTRLCGTFLGKRDGQKAVQLTK